MSASLHSNPLSAWRHLCTLGGLELNGRDRDLDERIHRGLDPKAPSFEQALTDADMSSFVRAFFEAMHPYVSMFRDILDFFERAEATHGESQWTLRVDDIDLSLEHFRTWLAAWDKLSKGAVMVPAIDAKAGWQLVKAMAKTRKVQDQIEESFHSGPLDISNDARDWTEAYTRGTYLQWPRSLSPSQCPRILAQSALIGQAVLQRLRDQSLTPVTLKDLYYQRHQEISARGRSDFYDPADGFDLWTIAQHETDLWLRRFVIALSATSRLPKRELTEIGDELNAITDRFPTRPVQVQATVNDLVSFLSLPLWEKRFDLYAAWIATEIIRALKGHDVEVHHDQGRIEFAFKETTLATVHSSPGPFKLVCERRTHLANPRGEGRSNGVQPDYGLWTMNGGSEVCKMVIEVKHYKNSSKAKFIDAFEDYATALPTGEVYLVNHGPSGNAVYEVSKPIRNRCKAIGHLTSSNREARETLAAAVQKCVGEPLPRWPGMAHRFDSSKVLLIDVSGSMTATMRSEAMSSFVRFLAETELPAKLVAADKTIVGEWDIGKAGFEQLLRLEGGSTDLSQPVAELLDRYETVLVITDGDGAASLQGVDFTQYRAQATAPAGIEVRVCRKP